MLFVRATEFWPVSNFEHLNFDIVSYLGFRISNFKFPLTLKCSLNQFGDVHDLDGNLIPSHIGSHGPDTLLT
jgi:hypothetical protein